MTSATDVARFLVQEFVDIRKSTTNMKLQKLLYFAWIEYYDYSKGKYLFDDKFSAWKLGPVIPDVYREYRIFAAMPISFTKPPDNNLDGDVVDFLKGFADRYKDVSASNLISRSHQEGKPWCRVYKEGERNTVIPFESIIRLECKAYGPRSY